MYLPESTTPVDDTWLTITWPVAFMWPGFLIILFMTENCKLFIALIVLRDNNLIVIFLVLEEDVHVTPVL